ncbi:EKC/KEOPS complex subunit GON7 [Heteronotia binoei]|uniref:EKC/KEOPS complex subunit GON7 n=1 Tax=Heteronotia binoei TaxID=13085 RepID=UPI0029314376|nr:EKC/KEOPS complex subunit GON7 [Heteronotia binoei]
MEIRGELTGRDGLKRQLRVCCQPQGDLRGLLSGLVLLKEQVSALLGPLVQQESGGACIRAETGDDEDLDEENDDEEENHVNANACRDGPPLKRTKTHS